MLHRRRRRLPRCVLLRHRRDVSSIWIWISVLHNLYQLSQCVVVLGEFSFLSILSHACHDWPVTAEADMWYCDVGKGCRFASGSCIGAAVGGSGSSAAASTSTPLNVAESPFASPSGGPAASTADSSQSSAASPTGNDVVQLRNANTLNSKIGFELFLALAVRFL
jgi:hypothetical protein